MKRLYYIAAFLFTMSLFAQNTKKMNTLTFEIPEAGIAFETPSGWSLFGKMGKLEQGRVEYNYTHGHVQGNGRVVNPAIVVTIDKGSWFDDEKSYLEEKLQFYRAMDDTIEKTHAPGTGDNPLGIAAYYSEGVAGESDHPYGERILLISFWTEKAGFHMEIRTSENDLKSRAAVYKAILRSVRKM